MQEINCGYTYPSVDSAKCVECGLCNKICPEITPVKLYEPKAVYAASCRDISELRSCASGGVATILGREIIRFGGVVYGCSQKNYRTIKHIRVCREEDLKELKGSKYVQSDMTGVYAAVKKDLIDGRKVLFVGTPCQTGALRSYLHRTYTNLYTVDLICHGVPSQTMLCNAVDQTVKRMVSTTDNVIVDFRWKSQSGVQFGMQYVNNRQLLKSVPVSQSAYMMAFMSGLSYRENCHSCRYSRRERAGDITIGDFWGLGKDSPTNIDTRHGVSLVMINTCSGVEFWNGVEKSLKTEIRTFEEAVKYNWNLHDPSPRPVGKDEFLKICSTRGLDAAMRACSPKYRIESTYVMRLIRRTPMLENTAKWIMRLIKKLK